MGFYPRHPRGWRQLDDVCAQCPLEFLSTPPSRVATDCRHEGRNHCHVSIHATLAGGDSRFNNKIWFSIRFYPRHPRGWRHMKEETVKYEQNVSIHATLAGGDDMSTICCRSTQSFLSTPPSRVATTLEWTHMPTNAMFLSTPPSRVATLFTFTG